MSGSTKYPRTLHLPWSPGRSRDDLILRDCRAFVGEEVVVTEKMDGEGTTMHRNGVHARSTTHTPHPARHWVCALQGRIAHRIPQDRRLCGENVFAAHSIPYRGLPSYYLLFGAVDGDRFRSWDDTVAIAQELDLATVPVLWRGVWNEASVRAAAWWRPTYSAKSEGYVVRVARAFDTTEFPRAVAKYVRAGHVQTDDHWLHRKLVRNELAKSATNGARTGRMA